MRPASSSPTRAHKYSRRLASDSAWRRKTGRSGSWRFQGRAETTTCKPLKLPIHSSKSKIAVWRRFASRISFRPSTSKRTSFSRNHRRSFFATPTCSRSKVARSRSRLIRRSSMTTGNGSCRDGFSAFLAAIRHARYFKIVVFPVPGSPRRMNRGTSLWICSTVPRSIESDARSPRRCRVALSVSSSPSLRFGSLDQARERSRKVRSRTVENPPSSSGSSIASRNSLACKQTAERQTTSRSCIRAQYSFLDSRGAL